MDENNHNVEAQQQTEENDETTRCQYCDAVKDEDELVECCECTNRMCDDCAHHCADCDTPICEDCAHTCERCDDIICDECSRWCDGCDWRYCGDCLEYCEECGASYCTSCMEEYHDHEDTQEPDYIDPYHSNAKARNVFTFGLEIEIGADHDHDMMQTNPLIAGWCPDGSLHKHGALEYQTQPMTMNQVDELTDLVARIEPVDDNSQAGGHMHISRADRQTPGRWYWALHALNKEQAESLNMRHMTETRWCQLMRGEYNGKATAINTHRHHRVPHLRPVVEPNSQQTHAGSHLHAYHVAVLPTPPALPAQTKRQHGHQHHRLPERHQRAHHQEGG